LLKGTRKLENTKERKEEEKRKRKRKRKKKERRTPLPPPGDVREVVVLPQISCQIPNSVVQSSLALLLPLVLEKPGVLQSTNVSILWQALARLLGEQRGRHTTLTAMICKRTTCHCC
jgi:hypothetical protein